MKKATFFLATLLCVLVMSTAVADMLISVKTDASVTKVAVFNEQGEMKSEVVSMKETQNEKNWTLRLSASQGTGTLYHKDAQGNWLRQSVSFDLSAVGQSTSNNTPPPQQPAWETRSYAPTPISLEWIPNDKRHQSRSGPGREYHGAGGYRHYKLTSVNALFVENGYVYVEQTYSTVARRRLYYSTNLVTSSLSGVPSVTLSGVPATLTTKSLPYFGPGKNYDEWDDAVLAEGTALMVFFEENGWVFAEFYANKELGTVRAWLPAADVTAD